MGESKMDKKMKRKLLLAGLGLGLTFTEAYLQNKISKNKDEKIEKLITEVRNELGGSRIEITPKQIKMKTEKFNIKRPDGLVSGANLTFKADEVAVGRHEKQFNFLSSKVDTLEEDLSGRLDRLENEVFEPVEDIDESVSYQPVYGHWGMDVANREENTLDKSPVLSEGIDETTKSTIGLVSSLDGEHLKMLYENLDGTYVYDMEDFHALVMQLFILQEAYKRKGKD